MKGIKKFFRNGKSFKDYLVRAALPKMGNAGGFESCVKGTCKPCDHIIRTKSFTTKGFGEVLIFNVGPLILRCKICDYTPYVGKVKTKFHLRFSNCKSKHRSFRKGN